MGKSLKELLDMLETSKLEKTASAKPTETPESGKADSILELIKTASANAEPEMEKNASAYGRIAARSFYDELCKIATEIPAEIVAQLPEQAPVSSQDLAAAAHAVALTASMAEQNQEKDDLSMRIQGVLASKDPAAIQAMKDELLSSGDPEKQKLGLAL